jgi:hypothetical protein
METYYSEAIMISSDDNWYGSYDSTSSDEEPTEKFC